MTKYTGLQIGAQRALAVWAGDPETLWLIGPFNDVVIFGFLFVIVRDMYEDWYELSWQEWLRKQLKMLTLLALYFAVWSLFWKTEGVAWNLYTEIDSMVANTFGQVHGYSWKECLIVVAVGCCSKLFVDWFWEL